MMDDCIFCRMVRGDIPARKVHEDAEVLAFHDIHPLAPIHFLIIPKIHVASLAECDASHAPILGRMMALVPRLAAELGAVDGFRTIINAGRVGGQEVYHLHIHIIGGPRPLGRMLASG
jgi:histidine triad (HIT) family protein